MSDYTEAQPPVGRGVQDVSEPSGACEAQLPLGTSTTYLVLPPLPPADLAISRGSASASASTPSLLSDHGTEADVDEIDDAYSQTGKVSVPESLSAASDEISSSGAGHAHAAYMASCNSPSLSDSDLNSVGRMNGAHTESVLAGQQAVYDQRLLYGVDNMNFMHTHASTDVTRYLHHTAATFPIGITTLPGNALAPTAAAKFAITAFLADKDEPLGFRISHVMDGTEHMWLVDGEQYLEFSRS